MPGGDDLIARVVSRCGISKAAGRRDLWRELEAHFEDAVEDARRGGQDEAGILQEVRGRFGDADTIADEFEQAYRLERRTAFVAEAVVLLGNSVFTVTVLIFCLQFLIAARLGIAPSNAFPAAQRELAAVISLTLGYTGVYLGEHLFRGRSLLKACGANCLLFVCLFGLTSEVWRFYTPAPLLLFLAGTAARGLQRTALRPVWCLGTLAPTIAVCLSAGRLLEVGITVPLWLAVLVRWAGLTFACYLLTLLAEYHEAVQELRQRG